MSEDLASLPFCLQPQPHDGFLSLKGCCLSPGSCPQASVCRWGAVSCLKTLILLSARHFPASGIGCALFCFYGRSLFLLLTVPGPWVVPAPALWVPEGERLVWRAGTCL